MSEEPKITMSEFKTVVESFNSKLQIVAEGIQLANEKMDREFLAVRKDIGYLINKSNSLSEQVALLHEGQTEIKIGLKQKVDRDEFANLERRVTRLEGKVA